MVTKCVVPNCGNSCNTKLSVTLFSFPKDPQLAQTWLQATRARGVKQIKSHHKVCSKHFEKHLILDNFGATRLEPGSIPTIFEWNRKPTGENEASPLVTLSNPFLTLEDVSKLPLNSCRRLILPKPAPGQPIPKVKIPPLVKRVSVVSSENKRTLDCDVILPDEERLAVSKILPREEVSEIQPRARMSPVRELSYRGYERIASKIATIHVSDDDSNGPVHVGHHIEEYDSPDCPLIEVDVPLPSEIDDPLSSGSDVLLDRPEPLAGEVIIEECSMIEDEIMQSHQVHEPIVSLIEEEYASKSLSNNIDVTVGVSETNSSQETQRLKQEDPPNLPVTTETAPNIAPMSKNMIKEPSDNSVPIKNLPKNIVVLQFDTKTGSCAENPDLNDLSAQDIACIKKSLSSSQTSRVVILKKNGQTKTEKMLPTVESSSYLPAKMQPILPKVPPSQSVANFLIATPTSSTSVSSQNATSQRALPPVVYQIGNVVPVNSSLTQKPQLPPQNSNVKMVAPQMTYLIPIGGAIAQHVAPKNTGSNGAGKSINEKKSTAVCSPTKAKKRRKFTKGKDEDDHPISSICTNSGSSSDVEQRLLKQVDSLKVALRRKTSTIKELRKDKNRLTKKLKLLGMALGKLRKASMLNLATSRFIERLDERVASNMTLDLKDLGREGKLGDVVSTIHYLSRILNDQVKSQLQPDGKQMDADGEVAVEVESC